MENKAVFITRTSHEVKQTLGQLAVTEAGATVYSCKTLELPWLNNKSRVSCIPVGTYKVVKRDSPKYGAHFHVQNVPGRDMILIHQGNYHTDILGCILVGQTHADLNHDGLRDVTSSKVTLAVLNKLLPNEFHLTIQ
jgi:Family of unknown function (DUF5675)